LSETIRNSRDLKTNFKDEYASTKGAAKVALGETLNALHLGDIAPKEAKDATAWWSRFDMLVTLPVRNKLFGASLTPGEKASFEKAQLARRGGDPALIREAVKEMEDIAARKLSGRKEALVKGGVDPAVVGALTAGTEPQAKKTKEDKQARINELVREGLDNAAIRARLKEEGF
jgi:hypothetical protein